MKLSIHSRFQQLHCWRLGMGKLFHPTLYKGSNYLSMLGLKLNHFIKRVSGVARWRYEIKTLQQRPPMEIIEIFFVVRAETVAQTVELPVIWNTMTPMCPHCKVRNQMRCPQSTASNWCDHYHTLTGPHWVWITQCAINPDVMRTHQINLIYIPGDHAGWQGYFIKSHNNALGNTSILVQYCLYRFAVFCKRFA